MMSIRKTLAVLGTALAMAGPAVAGNTYTRQVDQQIALVSANLAPDNWTLNRIFSGSLLQEQYGSARLTLARGRSYKIVAVCDEDCDDVDLSVYDDSGELIATDVDVDDFPTVTLRAPYTGTYELKVPMASCSRGPCSYGVAVFIR